MTTEANKIRHIVRAAEERLSASQERSSASAFYPQMAAIIVSEQWDFEITGDVFAEDPFSLIVTKSFCDTNLVRHLGAKLEFFLPKNTFLMFLVKWLERGSEYGEFIEGIHNWNISSAGLNLTSSNALIREVQIGLASGKSALDLCDNMVSDMISNLLKETK